MVTAKYLNTLTVKELQGRCKAMGLGGYAGRDKANLVRFMVRNEKKIDKKIIKKLKKENFRSIM